jgi:hypothetical protein
MDQPTIDALAAATAVKVKPGFFMWSSVSPEETSVTRYSRAPSVPSQRS